MDSSDFVPDALPDATLPISWAWKQHWEYTSLESPQTGFMKTPTDSFHGVLLTQCGWLMSTVSLSVINVYINKIDLLFELILISHVFDAFLQCNKTWPFLKLHLC